jgi:hypothetical protein
LQLLFDTDVERRLLLPPRVGDEPAQQVDEAVRLTPVAAVLDLRDVLSWSITLSMMARLRGMILSRSGGTTMNVSEDTSLTVGDEGLVWADAHSPDMKGVTFVRGRTFIHIKTQDLSVAKMFAEVIDTQIPRE